MNAPQNSTVSEIEDDDGQQTFDSPLQISLEKLVELQDRLANMKMRREARTLESVIRLLHTPDLLNSKPIDELIADGKVQSDEQLKSWLEAMEWMRKDPEDRASGIMSAHGSDRHASDRRSQSSLRPSSRFSKLSAGESLLTENFDAVHHLDPVEESSHAQRLIFPSLRKTLTTDAEGRTGLLLEHGIGEWEFDMFELDELTAGHAVCAFGWAVVERHGLRGALSIRAETLANFLQRVEEGYRQVPYHNAMHAADVAHGVYHLVTQREELAALFGSPIDIFSVVLAALVHDLGHTGHNNAFHVATGSELAILYSDQSVLEMHHLASAFQILKQKECNVLASIGDEARKEVRARVVAMVLATDLSVNFPTINAFKQMITDKTRELETNLAAQAAAKAASLAAIEKGIAQESAATSTSGSSPAYHDRKQHVAPHVTEQRSLASSSDSDTMYDSGRHDSDSAERRQSSGGRADMHKSRHSSAATRDRKDSQVPKSRHSWNRVKAAAAALHSTSHAAQLVAHKKKGKSGKLRDAMGAAQQWAQGGVAINSAEELLILKMVIKCSDIGNVTKGKEYCMQWTERVIEEFFAQGDLEGNLQLPVTPFMDRKHACVPKQQLGFYSFVARPMIEALDQLISMERPLKNLDAMQAHWNTKLVDEATEKEASVGKEGSTASLPASGPAGRSGSG